MSTQKLPFAQPYFYRLKQESERGRKFMQVLTDGKRCDEAADNLAKDCGAISYVPDIRADFGGIMFFKFPKKVIPDKEVFKTDGSKDLYIPNVTDIMLLEEYPYTLRQKPGVRERSDGVKHLGSELIEHLPRNVIAKAVHYQLQYLHPAEALNLLSVDKETIRRYVTNEITITSALSDVKPTKPYQKDLYDLALEADKENNAFYELVKNREFVIIFNYRGGEKALNLYEEIQALPVIAGGTLNHIVGCRQTSKRIGFFVLDGWIWVKTDKPSDLPLGEDWQEVSHEIYDVVLNEFKKTVK